MAGHRATLPHVGFPRMWRPSQSELIQAQRFTSGNLKPSPRRPVCMKRLLVPGLLLAAGVAQADVTPFSISVNYAFSNSFRKLNGTSGRLEGIELGVSQSVVKLPFMGEARVGVSALLGGMLRRGSDTDGTVYRVFAWYKTPMAGPSGVYALGGFSYANAQSRGGAFNNVSGFGADFGIGIPLKTAPVPGVPMPTLEVMWHQGSHAQTRGISVGINIKF